MRRTSRDSNFPGHMVLFMAKAIAVADVRGTLMKVLDGCLSKLFAQKPWWCTAPYLVLVLREPPVKCNRLELGRECKVAEGV